ncbi:hypothetical protein D9Q98_001787 [Chlorella vulgaris]|uniref:Alpha-1,3-mannosyl-glycoprotein 2-beta-N-acetylglucosaminyltransferase n=1 Tax=Chlorella vulgaris TaxID=3077 RepID=A0A9D4TV30_CHLVU|nr:hypothetical protein D9Q98_001787 [Chlorella vulgaris]
MSPKRAALSTLLIFVALFAFQLLWTHGQLEQLRDISHRGFRRRALARQASNAALESGKLAATQLDQQSRAHNDDAGRSNGSEGLAAGGTAALDNPAIIVFAYNRAAYLNQTLQSLLGLSGLEAHTVYVSQDGNESGVAGVAAGLAPEFSRRARGFELWQKQPRVPQLGGAQAGHAWLAQHYKWGLDRVFLERGHSHVVVVEDDMLFSPDFLLYFRATAPLLDADPTLWCVSSWNDNGFAASHEWNVSRLLRTSYFPGLGWMMKRQLWLELGPSWPLDHWDHWMRDDEVSGGRDCIVPEVNRNKNIGEEGANMNKQAFRRYLKTMGWNQNQTVSLWGDLSYLLQPAYAAEMRRQLAAAEPWEGQVGAGRRTAAKPRPGAVYAVYYTFEQYTRLAARMKLWPFPRAHFQHVASIPWMGARFLMADRRFCPLIPEAERVRASEGMQAVAGRQHQNCVDVCAERGMLCGRNDFWWLNTCSVLRKHFPCEHGCTVELGPDVPAYVAAANQTLFQYCLITQKASTCSAKHAATARLCPCVPLPADKRRQTLQHRERIQDSAG